MIEYDAHDWRSHLLDIRGSMVREIFGRVTTCVVWSALVVAADRFTQDIYGFSLAIDAIAHTLIGAALSLLLVFRTNASYDRFWEGRRQWGSIVNECRNLARATSAHLARDPATVSRILHWTMVFPWACMNHLRGTPGLGQPVASLPAAASLPDEQTAAVAASGHRPLAVSRRISAELAAEESISDFTRMTIDQNVQRLVDCIGACERIHNTPLPFAYVVHLRRALIMFCFTLPFALLGPFKWGTVLATLLIAYVLYGIEEIGVEIADPFGHDDNDLPLEQICRRIETDVREIHDATIPPG